MFKQLFKFLSRKPVRPAPAPAGIFGKPDASPAVGDTTEAPAGKPKAVLEWERANRRKVLRGTPPEQLCGISATMTQDQIREHLAMLYRRHNRAASSLDAHLREEAEIMLDAVVHCREKLLQAK